MLGAEKEAYAKYWDNETNSTLFIKRWQAEEINFGDHYALEPLGLLSPLSSCPQEHHRTQQGRLIHPLYLSSCNSLKLIEASPDSKAQESGRH